MAHLIAPTHSERFVALLSKHCPAWREARAELNELPLAAEDWAVRGGPQEERTKAVPLERPFNNRLQATRMKRRAHELGR
jgi:hypothetical protein